MKRIQRVSKELHKIRMKIKRIQQNARVSDYMWPITKNNSPEYRKN